jgi:hypothetical protein
MNADNDCEGSMIGQFLGGQIHRPRSGRSSGLMTTLLSLACAAGFSPEPASAVPFEGTATASIGDLESGGYSGYSSVLTPPDDGGVMAYGEPVYGRGHGGACGQPGCRGCRHCNGGQSGILNRVLGDACPRWTFQIDALMLWQGNIPATPLLAIDDPANARIVVSANQVVPDMAIGPRAAILLHLDQEYAVEANYFNVGSISGTKNFRGPRNDQLVWDAIAGISQFGNINDGTITSNGEIQSFELNWRHRHCGSNITWLAGFRWVEWNQSLRLRDNYDDGIDPPGIDRLNGATQNDLYGAQIGMDALLLDLWQVVRFNGVAKAGVYGNAAEATTAVDSDRAFFVPQTFTAAANQTGFFGELGVNGAVRLTDHVFWRAGYNFFWLAGVAVPAGQLAVVDASNDPATGRIDVGGSVFLHGVNTGLEVLW